MLLQEAVCKADRASVALRRSPCLPFAVAGSCEGMSVADAIAVAETLRELVPALRVHFEEAVRRVGATEETLDFDPLCGGAGPEPTACNALLMIAAVLERLVATVELTDHEDNLATLLSRFSSPPPHGRGPLVARPNAPGLTSAATKAFRFFAEHLRQMPTFSLSAAITSLLIAIATRAGGSDSNFGDTGPEMSGLALWCLQQDWEDLRRRATGRGKDARVSAGHDRDALARILSAHVRFAESRPEALSSVCREILLQMEPSLVHGRTADSADAGQGPPAFPAIPAAAFPQLFQVVMQGVGDEFGTLEGRASGMDKADMVARLGALVSLYVDVVGLTRRWEDTMVVGACLRHSSRIIQSFLRILPSLNKAFRLHQHTILPVLKTFQGGTRFLQHVCAHGKVERDRRALTAVPAVKRGLERMLFSVKQMLVDNGCLEAFWLGSLKHRDLQGKEVSSQIYSEEEEEEDAGSGDEDHEDGQQSDGDGQGD